MIKNKFDNWKKNIKFSWIALITLIISIAGFFASWKANSINQLQTQIAKNSELPDLQISKKNVYDDDYKTKEVIIQISNLGGKLHNYESEIITYLDCDLFSDSLLNNIFVLVPLEHYYLRDIYEGDLDNVIEIYSCWKKCSIIEQLMDDTLKFNEENEDHLYVDLISYVKISYVNLIGKEETEYFMLKNNDIELIEKKKGKKIFDKWIYNNRRFKMEIKYDESLEVQQLIDKMVEIHNATNIIGVFNGSLLDSVEGINMVHIIFGIVIGIGLVGSFEILVYYLKIKVHVHHISSLLYFDIKNIELYIKDQKERMNLLYTDSWKSMIAECNFLSFEEVSYLYELYNAVYNYNETYKVKSKNGKSIKKEEIQYFDILKRKIFLVNDKYIDESRYNVNYEKIMNKLKKGTKVIFC